MLTPDGNGRGGFGRREQRGSSHSELTLMEGTDAAVHVALPVKGGGVIIMMVSVGRLSGVEGKVDNGALRVYVELPMLER